jgi:hypothetical protein
MLSGRPQRAFFAEYNPHFGADTRIFRGCSTGERELVFAMGRWLEVRILAIIVYIPVFIGA